ncbi:MAG: Na/Pi symporter, partial [Bacteroidales bacterium]|nr:Na/Pi symporter [Bacteroidales bacterium]
FLGLELLKQNIPTPETSSLLLSELSRFTNLDFISILLFAIAGIILTIIIQSSSASFALILVMCHNGWIGLELSIAMILGMNLGTSSTAIIASLVANRSAKRAALAHLLFNLIGVIWGLSFFKYSIVGIDWLTLKIEGLSPSYNIATIPVALSLYHSLFNVLNATLLIFFVPQIIKVTELLIPSRTKKEYYSLKHLRSLISTSELTLLQARKLINAYGLRTAVMFEFIPQLLVEKEPSKYDKLLKQVHKYEDISDNMEDEIEAYLTHLSESELSRESSKNVYSMLKVIDNLENINDVCMKMSTLIDNKNKEKAWFTQEMRDELGEMFSLLIASLSLTNRNIEKLEESPDMSEVLELESKIDILRNVLVAGNNEKIQDKTIAYNTAKYFAEFVALCEKIGDLTLNINEALTEKV